MNRVHQLSDIEREALRQLHRETQQADVRSRCDMILLSEQGLSPPKIAQRVRFSSRTVLRYIERYEARAAGLVAAPEAGLTTPGDSRV